MKTLLIVVALLLAGCVSVEKATSWEGKPADDLVAAWGPPTNHARLSDGRLTLEYAESRRCRVTFLVSASGIVQTADVAGDPGPCTSLLKWRPSAGR